MSYHFPPKMSGSGVGCLYWIQGALQNRQLYSAEEAKAYSPKSPENEVTIYFLLRITFCMPYLASVVIPCYSLKLDVHRKENNISTFLIRETRSLIDGLCQTVMNIRICHGQIRRCRL